MAKADQEMRINAVEHKRPWDYLVDKHHTEQLKQIIAEFGWPTISMVGVEASNDAWLIVQHADEDRDFQKKCLELLKTLPKGEISLHNIAYLEDRILVAEHKTQIYGTQFYGRNSTLKPRPIKDPAHLDERRASMGLGTFAEYRKTMLEMHDND
jgi:hypothetical protein